jgi:hypothetical protein
MFVIRIYPKNFKKNKIVNVSSKLFCFDETSSVHQNWLKPVVFE